MDMFIKSLSLSSSTSVNDIAYPCMKLLDWLQKITLANYTLSSKDIEVIAKSTIFLYSCYKLFGKELTNCLFEQYEFYEEQLRTFFYDSADPSEFLNHVFEHIVKKVVPDEHIFQIESILHSYLNTEWSKITKTNKLLQISYDDNSELTGNRLKMINLVKSLHRLPSEQVDIAVKRSLDYIPFNVIGKCFCEPLNSCYSDFCVILVHKICQQISDICINAFFVKSLYENTSISRKGKRFYWLCLKNIDFANALITFLLFVVLESFKDQTNMFEYPEQVMYKKYKLNEILFLIWAALSPKSPCQYDLLNAIAKTNISRKLFNYISKYDCIYE